MVIVDEKTIMLPPPPPYLRSTTAGSSVEITNGAAPPPFPVPHAAPTLMALPANVLLYIVYKTFPMAPGKYANESQAELQRQTLYWIAHSLRLVSRTMYIASMHVLRSTYLTSYTELVKPPYSSDPFPHSESSSVASPTPSRSSFSPTPSYHEHEPPMPSPSSPAPWSTDSTLPITSQLQRETSVLDLFIAAKVREDVYADATELYLARPETFRDLFDVRQPRARVEDLVRFYGVREGVISVNSSPTPRVTSYSSRKVQPLPFSALSATFSTRKVGLMYAGRSGKRTVVEVTRMSKDEKLEVCAKKMVRDLGVWLASGR